MRRHGLAVVGIVLTVACGYVLQREMSDASVQQWALASQGLSARALVLAALLTASSYAVLTAYEQLAFVHASVSLARWRIGLTSFVACAISNTVGGSILSGAAVRFRFYSRWGMTNRQIAEVVAFYAATCWLGLLVVGGWGLWRTGVPGSGATGWTSALGAGLLLTASLYLLASVLWGHARLVGHACRLPGWRVASAQYVLSMLDWTLSAAVLWMLLPDPKPDFATVAVAFVVAQLAGTASHLPGGIGAFEALMVAQLRPLVPIEGLLVALVAFRGIYYAAPFAVALGILAADEGRVRWQRYDGGRRRELAEPATSRT
jgi:uncharacterized membrane protein YbhN (UPF0104 family)